MKMKLRYTWSGLFVTGLIADSFALIPFPTILLECSDEKKRKKNKKNRETLTFVQC